MNQDATSDDDDRGLVFTRLDQAVEECERLMQQGYRQTGNWTLAQVCHHLRLTQDGSVDGYPAWMSLFAPVRPLFRWLLLPKLKAGKSIRGIPTAKPFVPPQDLDDQAEVDAFVASVRRFHGHQGRFHRHPGFGVNSRAELESIHAAHAAHHLNFLLPQVGCRNVDGTKSL